MIAHLRYVLRLVGYACEMLAEVELVLENFRSYCFEHKNIIHESWVYSSAEWQSLIHMVRERVQALNRVLRKKLDRECEGG